MSSDAFPLAALGWPGLFLATAVIIIGALGFATRHNRSRGTVYIGPPLDAEETAYLAGGRDRAVQAALAALTVAAGRVPVVSTGQLVEPAPAQTNLQRAVAGSLSAGLSGRPLVTTPPVDSALDAIEHNLQLKGLLTAFGKTSRMGAAAVRAQRPQYEHFAPAYRPSWPTYGGAAAAMGVALFGYGVLETVDPGLPALFPRPARTDFPRYDSAYGGPSCSSNANNCAAGACGSSCGGSSCGGGGGCGGGGA